MGVLIIGLSMRYASSLNDEHMVDKTALAGDLIFNMVRSVENPMSNNDVADYAGSPELNGIRFPKGIFYLSQSPEKDSGSEIVGNLYRFKEEGMVRFIIFVKTTSGVVNYINDVDGSLKGGESYGVSYYSRKLEGFEFVGNWYFHPEKYFSYIELVEN